MYAQLAHLQIDASKIADVQSLILNRDAGTFQLSQGRFYTCTPVEGRTVALLFIGHGKFSMKPPTMIEREQLLRYYERDSVGIDFSMLFLLFADSTWEELLRSLPFKPGSVGMENEKVKYCLQYLCDDDKQEFASEFAYTFLHRKRNDLFYAHFSDEKAAPYFFEINPFEDEPVSFAKRAGPSYTHEREALTQFLRADEYKTATGEQSDGADVIGVQAYKIEAQIGDDLKLHATADVTISSKVDSLRWIPLTLFEKLAVDSVSWDLPGPVTFSRGKESEWLWLELPRSLQRGDSCTLVIRYNGVVLEKDQFGWTGLMSASGWYPRYGYRSKADFQLTFHTPVRWKFASAGRRESTETVGDTMISHWRTVRPTHNVSFAIGDFKEILPDGADSKMERGKDDSLSRITVYEFENAPGHGYSDLGGEVRDDMLNSMKFFQNVYGRSPVEDFYATETPYLHGEAFPGLIHLSWATYKHVDTKGGNELFRAHEVAHQWWGVGVNFKTYHDQWLSEGFAEYSGLWYMQAALKDNGKFFDALDKMRERIIGNRKFLLGSGQESGPVWLGYRTQSDETKGDYDLIVYQKGAWVLHMLRNMMLDLQSMNEDKFKNMMRDFYAQYLGKNASTDDFRHVVEKHFGINMEWFFRQWIMETKIPKYSFSYTDAKVADGKFKTVCKVTQENVPRDFTMPIPLLVKFADGRYVRLRIIVSGDKQEYELPLLPMEPVDIVFNDLHSVLCETN